jgi:hypothetical protein
MNLRDEIVNTQKEAMKAGDSKKLSILRMAFAAIKNEEINQRRTLEDKEVREIIRKQVKQLQDAMIDFEKGQRTDLIDQSKFEIGILSAYLPQQLSAEEVNGRVVAILSALGPKESLNQGQAMGAVMRELREIADGNVVKSAVAEYLK